MTRLPRVSISTKQQEFLSGTPNEEGIFLYTIIATNAEGNSSAALTVHSKSSIEVPIIESGHVVTVQGRSVDLVCKLISTGGAACSVDIYYGTSDQNESTGGLAK